MENPVKKSEEKAPKNERDSESARREFGDWLEKNAPALAELYQGALAMLYGKQEIPGWNIYVCHSVREIRNRLPEAITGRQFKGRFDYKTKLLGVAKLWKEDGLSLDEIVTSNASAPITEISISTPLFESIKTVLREHEELGDKNSDKARSLFESYGAYYQESPIPVANEWIKVTDWFEKQVHINAEEKKSVDKQQMVKEFEKFERIASSVIRSFFHTLGDLDEILEETNS